MYEVRCATYTCPACGNAYHQSDQKATPTRDSEGRLCHRARAVCRHCYAYIAHIKPVYTGCELCDVDMARDMDEYYDSIINDEED